jgi:TetR/AcrR family transcriptional repressor of nem operon
VRHFSELSESAERVVDAAEQLVQKLGYNGFSYDDIATMVGIKKPSVHHHFRTKAELVAVVTQRYTHRFRGALHEIEGRCPTADERLAEYASLFEKTFRADRRICVCGMLGAERDALPDEVRREVDRFFAANLDWVSGVFADGQRAGRFTPHAAPAAFAEALLCALEGALVVGRGMQRARGPAEVSATVLSAFAR